MSRLGPDGKWTWEISTDADEVHSLLCASDAYHATQNVPPPERSIATTRRRVQEGSVHLLRFEGAAVATFTLTWDAPFEADLSVFPKARKPAYLGRLAVMPAWLQNGSLAGARCLRKACELAASSGADALRSEANPDLYRVREMLHLFGFEEYGRASSKDGRRQVHLQKTLARTSPRA